MRMFYMKPTMLIECFDVEDIITLSSGGGGTPDGGDDPNGGESPPPGLDTEENTFAVPGGEVIGSEAGYDAQVIGGNELQENLENLYQNMVQDF